MTDVNANLQMASRPPTRKRHKPAGNPPATPRTSRTHNRSRSASPSPAKSMSSRRRSPAPTADRNHHAESPKNSESPTPESIVPSIPFTRRCRIHRTTSPVRKVVGLSNRYGNDGREYYVCPHPGCRSFVGWNDQIGVEDGNVKCYCGLPSRKQPGKSGIFFSCANPRRNCEYYEEEDDGPRGYFCSMILGHDGGDFDDFGDSNGDGDYYGEGYLNDMARNACCDGQYGA
ncbi:hypothetical protein BDD12DRAFT_344833 [Trichophaea hybrida]|nr:hypothetical protein BDD12DRAFT_344833 [Trichophaea hybrida]